MAPSSGQGPEAQTRGRGEGGRDHGAARKGREVGRGTDGRIRAHKVRALKWRSIQDFAAASEELDDISARLEADDAREKAAIDCMKVICIFIAENHVGI